MGKKVIVISNFHEDATISRSNMAFKYFTCRGYNTFALYSVFSHSLKKFRSFDEERFIPIPAIKYNSSLSLKRIFSYFIFSFNVFLYLRKTTTDIIYINVPPNILILAVFMGRKKGTKIILDILDLWPESFPHKGNPIKKTIMLSIGFFLKQIRKAGINKSDYCITESDFYFNKLLLSKKKKSKTTYLKKFQEQIPSFSNLSEHLSIVYLGNIGNIYDFVSLFKIIKKVEKNRPVHLHIIGLGPMSDWFFDTLKASRISYTYHGASFDEKLKIEVLPGCWFGFNGYKNNTEVALSYKTIDYLSYGVPLINSAKEDTYNIVISNKIGFNFNEENLYKLIAKLSTISREEVVEMKKRAYNIFQEKFSGQSYYNEMDEVMKNI